MRILEAVQGFLYTIAGNGYSEATIRNYRHNLTRFALHLGEKEVADITTTEIRNFLSYVRATPYTKPSGEVVKVKEATVHSYWKAIRSFFKWASIDLEIGRPDQTIPMPKVPQPDIQPFTQSEVKAILKACDYTTEAQTDRRKGFAMKRPTRLRDRALVLLLLDTGIRIGECARLQIRDVNLASGEVAIHAFGSGAKSKARHVYLGKTCRSTIWKYIASRKDALPSDALFASERGAPLDRFALKKLLSRLGERANVKNVYPHRFRHTFAIQALRNGSDVFTLQRMLGHSSLEMVRYYLTLVDADAAEAHRKASPVDRWYL